MCDNLILLCLQFWNLPADNPAHMPEMVQFLKNLALIGACFIYLGMRRTPSTKKKLD